MTNTETPLETTLLEQIQDAHAKPNQMNIDLLAHKIRNIEGLSADSKQRLLMTLYKFKGLPAEKVA